MPMQRKRAHSLIIAASAPQRKGIRAIVTMRLEWHKFVRYLLLKGARLILNTRPIHRRIIMDEVAKFLKENPVQYLATVGRDGRPKCRPFMFSGELGGKLWFCTNSTKEVYKDMQENPFIEVCTSSPSWAWIRISGEAAFENNMEAKEMSLQIPSVKSIYKEPSNPIFEVFYLKDARAVIADFSGDPPKEYSL